MKNGKDDVPPLGVGPPQQLPGGMVSHAREVVAVKADASVTAGDVARLVARGQAALTTSYETGPFSRDPYRVVLTAQAVALDPLPALAAVVEGAEERIKESTDNAIRNIERTGKTIIAKTQEIVGSMKHATISPEDKKAVFSLARDGGYDGTKEGVGDISWQLQWENSLFSVALAIGVGILAFALGQFTTLGEARAIRSEAKAMQSETAAKIAAHWTEVDSQRLTLGFAEQSLRLPPGEAAVLLRWIKANPNPAEAEKDASDVQTDLNGRRYACVHLWLDPQTVPPASHKSKGNTR